MLMMIPFPIIKIVVHKGDEAPYDTVFIFTGIKLPDGTGFLQIQIATPIGEGEQWVYNSLRTRNYEVVLEGFEVCSPV